MGGGVMEEAILIVGGLVLVVLVYIVVRGFGKKGYQEDKGKSLSD